MNYVVLMESIVKIILIIGVIALPVLIVWLNNRKKINEANQRTQIVLAAIEKNAETDVEDLLRKMAPQKTLLKEKLLTKLLWGCILTLLGLALTAFGCYLIASRGDWKNPFILLGPFIMPVGIAFLINYYVGRKILAKEIEAEQNQLLKQA
ncbi:MAG: hypothetical protein IKP30_02350 [Bacteroidaceae bacterium]|nr:hypothetical protein [Bacteroidaceae bacterium]